MLNSKDFEIGLEQQLRLRVINDEINQCSDIDVLKESLKNCTELVMKYQQILNSILKDKIEQDLAGFEEVTKKLGNSNS